MSEQGDYVLPQFFELDRSGEGGHNALLMGAPGQGKTSILQYFTYLAAVGKDPYGNQREKQACIWRARQEDRYLEFFNLGKDGGLGILLLPAGSDFTLYKVYDDDRREEITADDLEDAGIPYLFYKSPEDLVEQLEPGKIHCVLFAGTSLEETKFYSELFKALVKRKSRKWVHLSIDEAADILGPYDGDSYKVQAEFVKSVADFRKKMINSEFGCHAAKDLDYRIHSKLPYHIYKRGAKKMAGDTRYLRQETINGSKVGEAWFTFGAFYDKLEFPPMKEEAKLDYSLQTESRRFVVEKETF